MHKNSRCGRRGSIFRFETRKRERDGERGRENYKRGKERETTANSTKIKRKSGAPIFVQRMRRRRKRKGGKKGGEARGETRGAEDRGGEEEDAVESDGANDSLMKAEAARQKASLVFRSARVLLRHRSHPLCVYTCIRGVSDRPYSLSFSPPTIDAVRRQEIIVDCWARKRLSLSLCIATRYFEGDPSSLEFYAAHDFSDFV